MAKASKKSPEEKLRVVLSVLRGELSAAAGRRVGVSEQTVHNWKRLLLDAGRDGLAQGRGRRSARESELEAENEELKAALGEAHVQLRVWKKGADPPEVLEMIRADVGVSVSRFAHLVGVPRRTSTRTIAHPHRPERLPKGR